MKKLLPSVKLPPWRQILLLLCCWTILPFFLVEVIMIVLEPYLFRGLYQYDPDMGFKIRGHANGNNKFGFNDRDYPLQPDPDIFRMLIISDSFNWAGGQQGNYTALLENQFREHYGQHQVDVINAGYPGTHTAEQLALLKKYGLQYNPHLVVLGFFVGNDFVDADPYRKRIIVNDLYIDIDPRKELIIFGYPIIPKSRLLLFIQQKYKIFREARKFQQSYQLPQNQLVATTEAIALEEPEKSPGILSLEKFLDVERGRMSFCNIEKLQNGDRDANINYILDSISEMNAILKARNIKFIVAIYPDEYQVNDDLLHQLQSTFYLNLDDYDITCQQNILIEYLESNNIPYIDLTPRFRVEQQNRHLYLFQEPHWNSHGNQLAKDILFEHLVKITDSVFTTPDQ
ncbi:alginate O-acetyltransferase AlgX-related protein [Limnospira platensis CENA597]|uniref:alginate O-acetyltransferase AlgX-related protein n=1 Tax=Limnospira platensis TaxID=118562 RepID=UPI003DA19AA0